MGGATLRGAHGGSAMRGGGGAGLAAARVGGAWQRSGDGAKGGGGASLDVGGEDWEGLALQDTPIRGVGVANSSLDRGTSSQTNSRPAPPAGG